MQGRVERNGRIETALAGGLVRWVDRVDRHPRAVIAVIAILTLGFSAYTIPNLGVNLDNVKLVAPHVRAHHDAFAELFPNLENALLVVIDAEAPELARDAAERLAERLRARTDHFTDVYLPGGGSFFERNGLLYRTVDELDDFGDQMARIQPIIAELERDPSIENLASLVRRGLDQAHTDDTGIEEWSVILDRVGRATVRVYDEFPLAVSWEEVLLRGSSIEIVTRRVIVVHPILDFGSLLPAANAMAAIRETASELELDPARGVSVRVTGNPALNNDEMIGVAWDIVGAGVFCFALVILVLYLALRSVRLVAAAVITLLVGLIWTASFAAGTIGHLNIISICFAVLFIGLGVDFTIHLGMRYADLLRHHRLRRASRAQSRARPVPSREIRGHSGAMDAPEP